MQAALSSVNCMLNEKPSFSKNAIDFFKSTLQQSRFQQHVELLNLTKDRAIADEFFLPTHSSSKKNKNDPSGSTES